MSNFLDFASNILDFESTFWTFGISRRTFWILRRSYRHLIVVEYHLFLRRIRDLPGAFLGKRPPFPGPILGPIPCQIALANAHAMPDAHAHAMGRAGPGRPAHAPPHVRGPWGPRPRGRGGGAPAEAPQRGPSTWGGAWAGRPGPVRGMGQAAPAWYGGPPRPGIGGRLLVFPISSTDDF